MFGIEFLFPSYSEWEAEYQSLPWPKTIGWVYDKERWDPPVVFSHTMPLLRDILALPPQRDYYQPERAALVLETLSHQPTPIKRGGTGYAVWMVKLHDIHLPTSLMGAEICRGIISMKPQLVQQVTAEYVKSLLKQHDYLNLRATAWDILESWLKDDHKAPFATWLRDKASPKK